EGAFYTVAMYRLLIGHPRWTPPEELAQVDVRAGYNMGRIYRIYHQDRPPRPIKRLDKLDTAGLVAALESPNGPQRDLAMEMLIWRQDKEAVPLLKKSFKSKRPETQVHSLCALDQLRSLPADLVSDALFDDDGSVRRHAVRVCPNGLLDEFEIGAGLAVTIVDSDPQVRLEAAYVFGEGPLGQAEGDTPPRF